MLIADFNNNEKQLTWELLNIVANADNIVSDEEKEMLNSYKIELSGVNFDSRNKDLEQILIELSKSSHFVKKVICFEVFALIMADQHYDENEKTLFNKLISEFNISNDDEGTIKRLVLDLQSSYSNITNFLYQK